MFENTPEVGKESMVKVAAIQPDVKLGDVEYNVAKSIEKIKEAADNGAELIVLTELSNTGYTFNNRKEVYAVSEPVPEGKTTSRWIEVAKEKQVYIVAGISEIDGVDLYNTAVLVGPEGFIGKYRKNHLWDREKLWYEPGNLGVPVFNTKIGRIAMLICYDIWFQEMWRICSAKGADIVCCPLNAPRIAVLPDDVKTFANYNAMVAAYDNALSVVMCNRVGTERGLEFVGRTMITGVLGLPIGGLASDTEEEIKYADLNLSDSRRLHWGEFAAARIDRRVDLYEPLCGSEGKVLPF